YLALDNLAERIARQGRDDRQPPRQLVRGDLALAQEPLELAQRDRLPFARDDCCAELILAQPPLRDAHHGHLGDRRMPGEQPFDLLRRDLEPTSRDHLARASDEAVAVRRFGWAFDLEEVAGTKVPVRVE